MNPWADPDEVFVKVPGIVEVRFKSDDPEFYAPPVDLLEEQRRGLADTHGTKDKRTMIQSYFTCLLCEGDLYGVVPLRAHCRGTKHMSKAAQRKLEYTREKKSLELKDFVEKVTYKNEEKIRMKVEAEGQSNEYLEEN